MSDDPFRLNAKPQEEKGNKMADIFLEFFDILIAMGVFVTLGYFVQSCNSAHNIRASIIDCINRCDGHENVESYDVEGPNTCVCRTQSVIDRLIGQCEPPQESE